MTATPRQAVEALFADLTSDAPDPAAIAARFTDDVVYQIGVGMPLVQGRAALVAELARQGGIYRDLSLDVRTWVVAGGVVVTERVDEFTLAHNGVHATNPVVAIFEVGPDGLIRAWREYWDAAFLGQAINAPAAS